MVGCKIKKWIIFIVMFSGMGSCQVLAQFPYFVKANYIGGRVFPHRAGMDELKSTVNGAELELGVQLNGNDDWHVAYHYPMTGIGLHYNYLGNKEVLGYAAGFYGFIEIPLRRWDHSEIVYKLNSGLVHNSEWFSVEQNPTNIAISTRVNYYFHSGFRFRYWMSDATSVNLGGGISHYSNGAIRKPNKGLNQINVYAGLTSYITGSYDSYRDVKRPIVWNPSHEAYLLGALGKTNIYKGGYDDDDPRSNAGTNQTYLTGSVSAGWNYRYAPKRKAGLSLDGFYNEAFNWSFWAGEFIPRELNFWQLTRSGIAVNHEFFMKRLSIFTGLGVYIIRSPDIPELGSKSEEWMYERLGFRYYVMKHVFLNVSVKAYGFKAEMVEFGVGFSLNNMYSNFW